MRVFRFTLLAAALGLFALGGWHVSHGAYMMVKAELAQVLLDRAWAQSQATGTPTKAWSWADTWPVARVGVGRLNQNTIVLAGASGEALAFGPGHLSNTARPGDKGLSVIAAHRDTHFSFLRHVRLGDEISVRSMDGQEHVYLVDDLQIVRADSSGIQTSASGRRLALVTCFPFDAREQGPLRYVVFAKAIADDV